MWGLSASRALARLAHSSSRGLDWGCFTAKDKKQSAFWGIRSHRPRLMVEQFLGLFKVVDSKGSGKFRLQG